MMPTAARLVVAVIVEDIAFAIEVVEGGAVLVGPLKLLERELREAVEEVDAGVEIELLEN